MAAMTCLISHYQVLFFGVIFCQVGTSESAIWKVWHFEKDGGQALALNEAENASQFDARCDALRAPEKRVTSQTESVPFIIQTDLKIRLVGRF